MKFVKTWGIGIIGCGAIADVHIKAIEEIENARLTAVSSRTEEKARATGEKHNCFWSTDYRALLAREDVDIVCLTTSSGSHAELGKAVIEAGKHLIVEKPISVKLEDAEEMIGLAKERQVKLSVISQNRYKAPGRLAKQMLEQGKLGKLLFIQAITFFYRTQDYYDSADWRGTLSEDGGALLNQGIHMIDLLLWMGGPVRSVFGKTATQTHEMEAEDIGLATVTFANGAFGAITSSTSFKPGFPPELHIYGEKGTIRLSGSGVSTWEIDGVPMPDELKTDPTKGSEGGSNPMDISHQYHREQIKDMIEAVAEDREPGVTGEDGKNALKLIRAIYDSNQSSAEIQF